MTMTYTGKPSNDFSCDYAFSFNATVCLNAASKLWQLELKSEVEVLIYSVYIQYSKDNVHGLIHDWDNFLLFILKLN